jgi:hypothetical protein
MHAMFSRRLHARQLTVAALVLVLSAVPFVFMNNASGRTTSREAIFGVRYLVDIVGYERPLAFAVPAFVGLIISSLLWMLPSRWGFGIVVGLFAIASIAVADSNLRLMVRDSQIRSTESVNATKIEGLLSKADVLCVSLDRSGASQWHRFNNRARLARIEIREYQSERSNPPCGPFVLSANPVTARIEGIRLFSLEPNSGFALWVLEGTLQAKLEESNLLFPASFDGKLAAEDLAAEIEVRSVREIERGIRVNFRVTNAGTKTPWPGEATIFGRDYPVRAVVSIIDENGSPVASPFRLSLPPVVYSAEHVDLVIDIPEAILNKEEIRVQIEMVQDGNRWFGSPMVFSLAEALRFGDPAPVDEVGLFSSR